MQTVIKVPFQMTKKLWHTIGGGGDLVYSIYCVLIWFYLDIDFLIVGYGFILVYVEFHCSYILTLY